MSLWAYFTNKMEPEMVAFLEKSFPSIRIYDPSIYTISSQEDQWTGGVMNSDFGTMPTDFFLISSTFFAAFGPSVGAVQNAYVSVTQAVYSSVTNTSKAVFNNNYFLNTLWSASFNSLNNFKYQFKPYNPILILKDRYITQEISGTVSGGGAADVRFFTNMEILPVQRR